jgi:hypothetical protein
MNYLTFDRHELFQAYYDESDNHLLDLTLDTKREVIDYCLDHDIEYRNFENLMCGILDGYLYTDLLLEAKKLGLSKMLLFKVTQVYSIIFSEINQN